MLTFSPTPEALRCRHLQAQPHSRTHQPSWKDAPPRSALARFLHAARARDCKLAIILWPQAAPMSTSGVKLTQARTQTVCQRPGTTLAVAICGVAPDDIGGRRLVGGLTRHDGHRTAAAHRDIAHQPQRHQLGCSSSLTPSRSLPRPCTGLPPGRTWFVQCAFKAAPVSDWPRWAALTRSAFTYRCSMHAAGMGAAPWTRTRACARCTPPVKLVFFKWTLSVVGHGLSETSPAWWPVFGPSFVVPMKTKFRRRIHSPRALRLPRGRP